MSDREGYPASSSGLHTYARAQASVHTCAHNAHMGTRVENKRKKKVTGRTTESMVVCTRNGGGERTDLSPEVTVALSGQSLLYQRGRLAAAPAVGGTHS